MAADHLQVNVTASLTGPPTEPASASGGVARTGSGIVAKLKSFRLRFAGASTVRKKKRARASRRDSSSDDEENAEGGVRNGGTASRERDGAGGLDSQEVRIQLAQSFADPESVSGPTTTETQPQDTNRENGKEHSAVLVSRNEPGEVETEQLTHTSPQDEGGDGGSDGGGNDDSGDPDAFRFYPTEFEPHIPPDIEHRAKEALEEILSEPEESSPSCLSACCAAIQPRRLPGDGAIPEFTPLLQKASRQGLKVAVSFLNPSMPRALRDAWVLIELAVTIYQFVLASFSLAENHTEVFNILYIVLASIALGLSLIDVMVHCVQLGSCALCVLYCRSKLSSKSKPKRKNSDPESIQSFCLFGKKWRKRINNSLELVRSVASELIFYPLLICDMFDFVATGSYRRADSGQRINFSLFVVGGFYLILAVYLARMLMIGFSLFSLRRIPPSASHTQRAYVNLAIKFGAHILGQMALSVVIIAAIGMKIRQENSAPCSDGSCVTASGFLIYAIISGGIVPLLGIFSFFFTHYYKIRVMSVSLLVDMVSMLQSESFTSVVFAKEGIKKAKTMARNLVEKVQLIEIRKQLKGVIQSMPSWAKILYPLRFPGFWVFGIVYALLLASFVVTLFLSDDGTVEVSNELASFIIAGVFLVIVNIHILLLASVIVAILAVILLLVLLSPALLVLAAIFYLPVGCFFGCMYYCHDLAEETGVFSSPSAHKTRIQNAIQQTRQELHK